MGFALAESYTSGGSNQSEDGGLDLFAKRRKSELVDPIGLVSAEEFRFEAVGSWELLWLPELVDNLVRTVFKEVNLRAPGWLSG